MLVPFSSSMPSDEFPSTNRECANCSHELNDTYCPACGQRDLDFKKDWRGLFGEYAASFLNIDGKVPRGIFQLLFLPGQMTKEFLAGKRTSQMPPLRLYLFASLLFFLWTSAQDVTNIDTPSAEEMGITQADLKDGSVDFKLSEMMQEKFSDPEAFQAAFNTWLPRVFLLGVPTLALATLIVFWKKKYSYLEHIIVSMHLQTFLLLWIFFIGISSNLIGKIHSETGGYFWNVFIWWIQIYPVFALRKIFGLSWKRSIFSTIALEFAFFFMIGAAVMLGLVMAFFFG